MDLKAPHLPRTRASNQVGLARKGSGGRRPVASGTKLRKPEKRSSEKRQQQHTAEGPGTPPFQTKPSSGAEEQLRRHIIQAYESPHASSAVARTPSLEPASVWLLRTFERFENAYDPAAEAIKIAMEKGGALADEIDAAEFGGLTCSQIQECLKSIGVPPIPASLAKILPGRYPKHRYRVMRKSSVRTGSDAATLKMGEVEKGSIISPLETRAIIHQAGGSPSGG
eukprot:SAG31_NODE_7090_length_1791_cov_2.701537_3_plen_224_part_01